jgi:hypothetical protein
MKFHSMQGDAARTAGRLVTNLSQRLRRSTRRTNRSFSRTRIESLEQRALLTGGDDLLMMIENARVMALVPDGSFQDTAINSGDWTNAATWQSGTVPKNMDNVLISPNVTVTISSDLSKDSAGNRVAIHALRVDGTLAFDTSNVSKHNNALRRLLVDTIVVTAPSATNPAGGTFQMGTQNAPIPAGVLASVVFADNGPVNAPANTDTAQSTLWPAGDPYELSRGLIVMGAASIYGTEVTSFVPVQPGSSGATLLGPTSAASAPVTAITLAPSGNSNGNPGHGPHSGNSLGWNVGDRLIITGDTVPNAANQNQDEQVAIKAITTDPVSGLTQITINVPLQYLHSAPAGASIYVADVSRNAVFSSENVTQVADRGAVMFMHTTNVQVDAAGFYGLGRTDKRTTIDDAKPVIDPANPGTPDHPNYTDDVIDPATGQRVMVPQVDANGNPVIGSDGKPVLVVARTGMNPRGRYSVHFHHDMPMDGSMGAMTPMVNDSAVVDGTGWGIVNHSSNVDVTNNVVFNVVGAAYVTEAGDETGTFDHNIAIHSQGASGTPESRPAAQDFGFQGNGFWFQGGNITVTNNVATGQRSSGFILFSAGLIQSIPVSIGSDGKPVWQPVTTAIPASALSWASWAPTDPTVMVPDGNVPLKQFSNNVSFANGDGFESWFNLLNVTDPRVTTVIQGLKVYYSPAINVMTPYTHNIVFDHVTLLGNVNNPLTGTGFSGNGATANVTYKDVDVEGFALGIDTPRRGTNSIIGGTFQDVEAIYITTSIDHSRVITIGDDAATGQPISFITLSPTALGPNVQYDIYLQSNYTQPRNDITLLFNPDVVALGTVQYKGQQLYYLEQRADYVAFPSNTAASYIPTALEDLTNAAMFAKYGLAVGGLVAPSDGVINPPRIHGILGSQTSYGPIVNLWGPRYTQFNPANPSYRLAYSYLAPGSATLAVTSEAGMSQLVQGWNLLTRNMTIGGISYVRTILVYGDNIAPTFTLGTGVPTTLNIADWNSGSTWQFAGTIYDDSVGTMPLRLNAKLGSTTYFPDGLLTDANGTYVVFRLIIADLAGNQTQLAITLRLTANATLLKDLGRKILPEIIPSDTLIFLLDFVPPPKKKP